MKLDLGCGPRKREDGEWVGVDLIKFDCVDHVMDIFEYLKTVKNESVEAINLAHVFEHFEPEQRIVLMNECFRVLKPKGQVFLTSPCWSHERAYGDPTHKWPPVCTWTFLYLNKKWRDENAPHCGYECDFDWNVVGSYDQNDQYIAFRNNETKSVLMGRNINVTTDIIATLTKI